MREKVLACPCRNLVTAPVISVPSRAISRQSRDNLAPISCKSRDNLVPISCQSRAISTVAEGDARPSVRGGKGAQKASHRPCVHLDARCHARQTALPQRTRRRRETHFRSASRVYSWSVSSSSRMHPAPTVIMRISRGVGSGCACNVCVTYVTRDVASGVCNMRRSCNVSRDARDARNACNACNGTPPPSRRAARGSHPNVPSSGREAGQPTAEAEGTRGGQWRRGGWGGAGQGHSRDQHRGLPCAAPHPEQTAKIRERLPRARRCV